MSTLAANMKNRIDENGTDKAGKLKNIGSSAAENTKRSALGDLQNRAALRHVGSGKEAVQNDLKTALRNTKPRVDTHWKKPSTTATAVTNTLLKNAIGTGVAPSVAPTKILTRSNSMRVNSAATGIAVVNGAGMAQKTKTLTAKVVENKIQHVKVIKKTVKPEGPSVKSNTASSGVSIIPSLKREDSNLARRSLAKLKALTRETGPKPTVVKSSSTVTNLVAVKKSSAPPSVAASASVTACKENRETRPVASAKVKSDYDVITRPTHSSRMLADVEDIDADDRDNLILVSEYVNDIYDYLYSLEDAQPIQKNHLEGQLEVMPQMRAVLIDWISEVHLQFHLAPETYQMAVAIIDVYLQKVKTTKRSMLQLVGVTALFLASKYEELFAPVLRDFVFITDDTYTAKQIIEMELKIFQAIDCNLSYPLPIHFLRRYSKAAKAEDCHHSMSKYFVELVTVEYTMAWYKPSEIAASSLFLSLNLLNGDHRKPTGFNDSLWSPTLQWYSRYSPEHLRPIAKKIAALARNAPNAKLKGVYNKYQSSKFHKVSTRPELYSKLMDSIIAAE